MTTEPKPYTVADLRKWANQYREFACRGYQEIDPAHAADARAQAAAFDALADGMPAIETHDKLHANKATAHWLWVALSRAAAGEDVEQVMRDYGWVRKP